MLPALRNNNADARKGEGWPITFRHLGKAGYELTLYAANQAARQKWLEFIDAAQQRLRSRADFLNTTVIPSNFMTAVNKVNCAAPFGKLETPITTRRSFVANEANRWRPQVDIRNG